MTTVEKVAAYMGIDVTASRDVLTSLIGSVSEAIEHYCGREFARRSRTEILDGRGTGTLLLSCRPIALIEDVRLDARHAFGPETAIDGEGIVFYGSAGLLHWEEGVFPLGRQNVRVVYTAGYETVPPSIEQAANMLVAHFYNRGHQGGDGVTSESIGAYSVSYNDADWPAAARTLLNEFREVRV